MSAIHPTPVGSPRGIILSLPAPQDENLLPPHVAAALERVRGGADLMPKWQLDRVIKEELGEDWRSKFLSFDDEPIAAASIGQVGV